VGQGIYEGRLVMQLSLFEEDKKVDLPNSSVRLKACSTCREVFPETEENFYRAYTGLGRNGKQTATHLSNKCKVCHNKGTAAQRSLNKIHGHKAFGTCDCCGVDAKDLKEGRLNLDHCHVTGEYRGHLCGSCNRGLGMLGDNLAGVQLALDYLKRVESKR
jgi:hypothetical protein